MPGSTPQTKTVPRGIPTRRDPAVNDGTGDVVPDHPPAIPWPAAPGTKTNPIRK